MAAATRHAVGIIGRPQQSRLPRKDIEDFLLVPGMVSRRDHRHSEIEEFVHQIWSDAEPPGYILPITDDHVDIMLANELRK
jgi:hypothetical protein